MRQLAVAMLFLAVVHVEFGQGGPPMIFTGNYILIISMGTKLRSPDERTALIGYFGMQFVY